LFLLCGGNKGGKRKLKMEGEGRRNGENVPAWRLPSKQGSWTR
jgi:hypothetical protein